MTDLRVENYSEKSIVVRGNTKEHKEALKAMGGKWNSNLKDGGGWIFSKKLEDKILYYAANGKFAEKFPQEKLENVEKSKIKQYTENRSSKIDNIISQLKDLSHTFSNEEKFYAIRSLSTYIASLANFENKINFASNFVSNNDEIVVSDEHDIPKTRLLA